MLMIKFVIKVVSLRVKIQLRTTITIRMINYWYVWEFHLTLRSATISSSSILSVSENVLSRLDSVAEHEAEVAVAVTVDPSNLFRCSGVDLPELSQLSPPPPPPAAAAAALAAALAASASTLFLAFALMLAMRSSVESSLLRLEAGQVLLFNK